MISSDHAQASASGTTIMPCCDSWHNVAANYFFHPSHHMMVHVQQQQKIKQGRKALLKAEYCPRVAAVSCTQKNPRDLDLWFMTLLFKRFLKVFKVHVRASAGSHNTKNTHKIMWPWPLRYVKFNRVLEVAEIYVYTKFHQDTCNGS